MGRGPKPQPPGPGASTENWDEYYRYLRIWEDAGKKRRRSGGGTMNATSFKSKAQRNDPSVTNHYFNSPGDGGEHGHVKERRNPDGTVDYPFVRDVEGNEYDV